jgi:hypothetical protein
MSIYCHHDLADAKGKIGVQGLAEDLGRKSVLIRVPLNCLVCGEERKLIFLVNDLLGCAVSVGVNLPSNLLGSVGKPELFGDEWTMHGVNSGGMHCLQGCSSHACGGNSCRQRQEPFFISSLDVRNRYD